VIVNEKLEIIHSRGDTSPYLQLAPGRATFAVLKMAREAFAVNCGNCWPRQRARRAGPCGRFQQSDGSEIRSIRLEVRRITDPRIMGAVSWSCSFPNE